MSESVDIARLRYRAEHSPHVLSPNDVIAALDELEAARAVCDALSKTNGLQLSPYAAVKFNAYRKRFGGGV